MDSTKLVMFAATAAVALANGMDGAELALFTDFLGLLKCNLDTLRKQQKREH